MLNNIFIKYFITILYSFIFLFVSASSQETDEIYINEIIIESGDVFNKTDSLGFIGRAANAIHWETRDYMIEDYISLVAGEFNDTDRLLESERVLRSTGLFTDVKIELEELEDGSFNAYVVTKDRFTLEPAILYGFGGGVENIGGRLAEYNLLGTGTTLSAELITTTENDLGFIGGMNFTIPNTFSSLVTLFGGYNSSDLNNTWRAGFVKPYFYIADGHSFGASYMKRRGDILRYKRNEEGFVQILNETNYARGFYSIALEKESMIYATVLVDMNYVNRDTFGFRRALDNTGSFLVSFSSHSKDFSTVKKGDYYQVQDIQTGGYGEAVLGRIFPIGRGGEQLYYAGATGERSYYDETNYIFARLGAGSGFAQGGAKLTFQYSDIKAFRNLNEQFVAATSFTQRTAWNWDPSRQLVLDFQSGLRGYDANSLVGDNRMISNTEIIWMPDYTRLWIFDIGVAAFFDIGSVWDTGQQITDAQWKSSTGLGLRLFNSKNTGVNSILRVDFAWSNETNSFGGIIITTGHLFSLFQNHNYRLPSIYGGNFDEF
ncbi:MAG: hypothetical protein Kapaf2KO_08890 [Candidatus Kapaibacteriales bacterium]